MTRDWTALLRGGLLGFALLLGSCGGGVGADGTSVSGAPGIGSGGTGVASGEGVGSGGTGITPVATVGTIAGFGSIIVNGIRYDIGSARLLLSDAAALKLGMTVSVAGTVDAALAQGTATLVVSAADLRGQVAALDPSAGFDVLAVHVAVDSGTVYAGGLASAAALANGMPVQVYGVPGAGGKLHATRIERLAAAQDIVLSGTAAGVDARASTFAIGSLVVRYGAATFPGDWSAANLTSGAVVRVRGSMQNGAFVATSVEPWAPVAPPDGQRLSLAGQVTDFVDARTLRIDGVPVDLTQAQVSGGSLATLGNGARVEASGTMSGGILVVSRLKVREGAEAPSSTPAPQAPQAYTAQGSVGSFRSVASFKVQGQEVDASRATFLNGTARDLSSGSKVLVTGSRVSDDVLVADQVEFLR